jgi:hypothetical protein
MQRRDFIKKSAVVTGALSASALGAAQAQQAPKNKELYELRVYTMRWSQAPLDEYLSKALIPALNKSGVKQIGAFREMSKSEPTKLYLLIPYASFEDYGKTTMALKNDQSFQQASATYNQIPQENAVYDRVESSLLLAFDGIPKMIVPAQGPRIFELRTYEGYSEDAVRRKVKMFNEGELDIFNRVKLNSVFFGEMLAGKNLPCIVYMLSFKDMEDHDKSWKAFGQDPDWQKISKAPEYENSVSRIYKTFLEPLPYSQV